MNPKSIWSDLSSPAARRIWAPIFVLLVIALTALLLVVFRDAVRELILIPLLYLLWLVDLVLAYIPQTMIWAILLLLGLWMAVRSFDRARDEAASAATTSDLQSGRVRMWAKRLELARRGRYSRWRLAWYLGQWFAEAAGYDERCTPKEIKARLRDEALNLPPELHAYLRAAILQRTPPHRTGPFTWLRRRLGWRPQPRASSPLALDPTEIVIFIEEKLRSPKEKPPNL